jgi:ribosome-binding protein aMBF1 (putative translation factor)
MSIITRPGRSLDEFRAERERADPEYRRAYLKIRVSVDIANAVTIGRTRKGWTQARLAAAIGTTESVISRIESGRHGVNTETLRRLANVLGVTFAIGPDPVLGEEQRP